MASPPKRARKPRAAAAASSDAPPAREPKIGDNNPPVELTPLETAQKQMEDVYQQATDWLDGAPIHNEAQAEEVTKLKNLIVEVANQAEASRKAEADPLHKAWKAVNEAYKPISTKLEKAKVAANNALTAWMNAKAAEQARIAAERQKAADEAAEKLRRAHEQARESSNLAEIEAQEQLEADAEDAARAARAAQKETATVRTEFGRASLRTYWFVEIENEENSAGELLKHYRKTDPEWLKGVLLDRAKSDVHKGTRHLPGCRIWSEKKAI